MPVYVGTHAKLHRKYTHTGCVVPILLSYTGFSSGENERKLFTEEINVMKRVSVGNNPHVLKMIGCVTTTLPVMLVMQYVPNGSLKDYLRATKV